MSGQSAEDWARTVHLTTPVSLGEVEAGVLAREPEVADETPWWMPLAVLASWAALGIAYLLGLGVTVLGLLFVWLGTRSDGGDHGDTWLAVAQMVFVCAAVAEVSLVWAAWRSRRRDWIEWLSAALVIVASAGSLALLRAAEGVDAPWALAPAVVACAVLGLAVLAASLVRRPESTAASRRPPARGPRSQALHARYTRARGRVLDILGERGLVSFDDADKQRLNEMPLGYWEELDGIDDRERRRILEYRIVGWREFDSSDERPWRRPTHDPRVQT